MSFKIIDGKYVFLNPPKTVGEHYLVQGIKSPVSCTLKHRFTGEFAEWLAREKIDCTLDLYGLSGGSAISFNNKDDAVYFKLKWL
jgi:hypothetical protein